MFSTKLTSCKYHKSASAIVAKNAAVWVHLISGTQTTGIGGAEDKSPLLVPLPVLLMTASVLTWGI